MTTMLSQRTRKAAHGKHRCGYCRQPIAAGEKYDDARIADLGTVWTWRSHLRCLAFLRDVAEQDTWDDGIDAVLFADLVVEYSDAAARHGVTS